MTNVCPLVSGNASNNAIELFDFEIFFDGISPEIILQKIQSVKAQQLYPMQGLYQTL